MWIITDKGFVSAVEYRPKKDRINPVDGKPMQLPDSLRVFPEDGTRAEKRRFKRLTQHGFILARARVAEDLEQLRPYFEELEIKEDKGADYKFRCVLPRVAYANWTYDKSLGIDYDSHFKEVVKDRAPKDPERYPAMMSCWSALNRMGRPKVAKKYGKPSGSSGSGPSKGLYGGFGGGSGGYDQGLDFDNLYPWQKDGQDVDGGREARTAPSTRKAPDLGKLLGLLAQMPVEQVELPNDTADHVFFVWTEAADKFPEHTGGLDTDELIELMEDCLGKAKDDEASIFQDALEKLHDVAVDEDETTSTGRHAVSVDEAVENIREAGLLATEADTDGAG